MGTTVLFERCGFYPIHALLLLVLVMMTSAQIVHGVAKASPGGRGEYHTLSTITITAGFVQPTGLAVDRRGYLLVADSGSRVRKVGMKGKIRSVWGMKGTAFGQFDTPNLLALDAHDNLYVADSRNNRIQKLSPRGDPLAVWGTAGTGPGQFSRPLAVTVDRKGNIYVADTFNDRVQKLSPTGKVDGSWPHDLGLHHPAGITTDARGDIFIADTGNNRIIKVSPNGVKMDWGFGLQIQRPTGLAIGKAGTIYVVARVANNVQEISAAGKLLHTWGKGGTGPGQFSFRSQGNMNGVAVDSRGNVYVADTGNNRVKMLSPSGKLLRIWR